MQLRTIERIFRTNDVHWVGNGFRVKTYFPDFQDKSFYTRFSPFLLLDYNEPWYFEASPFEVGVGPHPHRGFETVTIALAGKVQHHDNQGHAGVIESGDLQWMTAAKGIMHKEYHEKEYSKTNRVLHMIQLWIDLPKKHKMVDPHYQPITKDQMGVWRSDDDKAKIIVYAGEVKGVKGPAHTYSPIDLYKVDLKEGKTLYIDENSKYNLGLLLVNGNVMVNNERKAVNGDFVLFKNDADSYSLTAVDGDAEVFVMAGEPLNQPVEHYGPFVMNTRGEIDEAQLDFYNGKFGKHNF